jgi:hypothetical protein
MPLRGPVSDLQVLHYANPVKTGTTDDGEDIMGYGAPEEFMATVGVPAGETAAAQYGQKLPSVRTLSTGNLRLKEGAGIWVDAPTTREPDYKVIADRSTPRQYRCDIGKRGAFGG